MITVRADIKRFFFDRDRVLKAVSRARRRALSRAGAFVRTRARTSIRKRKGTSPAGSPPYSHVGTLRKGILFGYDPARESVVVGPVGFAGSRAPSLLEFGGTVPGEGRLLTVAADVGRDASGRFASRQTRVRVTGNLTYEPRPYMGPALEAELAAGTIPKHWANSVRSS